MRLKALLCGMLFFSLLVRGAEPPTVPLLRLEIGTHLSAVKQIGIDAAGRWGRDGGARQDRAGMGSPDPAPGPDPAGPPLDRATEGQLYACAISPDGRYVAAAGWTGWDWDGKCQRLRLRSGRRRETGAPGVGLAQCHQPARGSPPDGTRLALCLHSGHGIRVLKIPSGEEAFRDTRLRSACLMGWISMPPAAWPPLATMASSDSTTPSGRKLAEAQDAGGGNPFMLRFSPDGQRLAVGFQGRRHGVGSTPEAI